MQTLLLSTQTHIHTANNYPAIFDCGLKKALTYLVVLQKVHIKHHIFIEIRRRKKEGGVRV